MRTLSRPLLKAIRTNTVGQLVRFIRLGGFQYGRINDLAGTGGFTTNGQRPGLFTTLFQSSFNWRTISSVSHPYLSGVGDIVETRDRGAEFSFEWTPQDGTTVESLIGQLAQQDINYNLIQTDVPSTTEHAVRVDSAVANVSKNKDGVMQVITVGSSIASQQWTLSCMVAALDIDGMFGNIFGQVRLTIQRADNTDQTSTLLNYTASGKYQRLSLTKTFSATAGTQFKVIIGPSTKMLVTGVQMELGAAPTAYEKTGASAGVRNVVLNSHFVTASPWTTQVTAGQAVTTAVGAGRGPENRFLDPNPPGFIDVGLAYGVGPGFSDGLVQFNPYDQYGQTGDKQTTTAAGRCGIYKGVPGNGGVSYNKTYLASAWVRSTGSNVPAAVGIMLSPWDNTSTHLFDDISPDMPITSTWRRIWWATYVAGSYTTAVYMEAFFFSNDPASGKESEWFGFQLEEFSGDSPKFPAYYEPTAGAAGSVNLIQQSADMNNAYWGKQSVTITSNTAYAPIEYYDMIHPDRGTAPNRLRINQIWNPASDTSWAESIAGAGDVMYLEGYSLGAYVGDILARAGDFIWTSPTALTGWTLGGTTANITKAATRPQYWEDDEEAVGVSGVAFALTGNETVPAQWISKSVSLTAGWHTLRARVQNQGTSYQSTVQMSLMRSTDSHYLEADWCRFRSTTEVWNSPRGRNIGAIPTCTGLAVWHFFVPTTTTYTLKVGCRQAVAPPATTMYVDQLRLYGNAGALYASPTDRGETAGTTAFLLQGLSVLFRGVIDDATDGTPSSLNVRCIDYARGTDQLVPSKTTKAECQLTFRGQDCGYVNSTTFTANSVATTGPHTVASVANLVVGRYITDRTGQAVGGKILTINTGANQFTTDTALTFNIDDLCTYADCRLTYGDCYKRQRTHRYLGARATVMTQATLGGISYFRAAGPPSSKRSEGDAIEQIRRNASELVPAITASGQDYLNEKVIFDARSVPLVLGRKSVQMIPIESHAIKYATTGDEFLVTFYAMAWGQIGGLRSGIPGLSWDPFFTKDGPLVHNPSKGVGIYWRDGQIGADDWWKLSDHTGALATQKIPNQYRDFRTNTDNAYSRWAYAIAQIAKGNPLIDLKDPAKIIEGLQADMYGLLCQKYDANGVPQGSPVWTRNPIWQMVEVLTDRTFGPGFPVNLFNWASLKAAADICDVQINSAAQANVRSTATSVVIEVDSTSDFSPEMPILHNGTNVRTVKMVDPINQRLVLDSALGVTAGDTIQGQPARYTCDITFNKQVSLTEFIDKLLATCRGQLIFSGGKIGVNIDLNTTTVQYLISTPTPSPSVASSSSYLGVMVGSVRYEGRSGTKDNYNAIEVTYESGTTLMGVPKVVKFADADLGGLDQPRILKVTLDGVDTGDQALRCGLAILARASSAYVTSGGSNDPRGFTVRTGLPGIQLQLGETAQLQRSNRPTLTGARIAGIRIASDFSTEIKCVPESRTFRASGYLPVFDAYTDTPTSGIRGEMGTQLPLGTLTFTVTQSSAGVLKVLFSVDGYTAGPGTNAGLNLNKFAGFELHASTTSSFIPTTGMFGLGGTLIAQLDATAREFEWAVPSGLLETPLYVKLVGLLGAVGLPPVYSSEVNVTIFRTDRPTSDPTQQEGSQALNMVYGADFDNAADWPDNETPVRNSGAAYPGTLLNPTKVTSPVAAGQTIGTFTGLTKTVVSMRRADNVTDAADANVGDMTDTSDTTYYGRTGSYDWTTTPDSITIPNVKIFNFGAGTNVVGRIYARVTHAASTGADLGTIRVYYSQDASVATPTWVYVGPFSPSSGVFTDVYGPEVTASDLSKFGIGIEVVASQVFSGGTNNYIGRVVKAHFEQKGAPAYTGSVSGNIGTIYGNGTNYGYLYRPFPGKTPAGGNQQVFSASTLNHMRLQVKKHNSGDTLDANKDVEIVIYDYNNQTNEWIIGTIPAADITASWVDHAIKFSPSSPITGSALKVAIRTKNSKPIDIDKLLVARGDTLFAWTTSPENQSAGYFGDFTNGDADGFSKGSWAAGDRKTSTVS